MTRRGSLAYYLAAVVVGCFAMTACLWFYHVLVELPHPGLLNLYFLSLLTGSFTALVFAFLLRLVMAVVNGRTGRQWLFSGAVLALLLVWGMGSLAIAFAPVRKGPLWMALLGGPVFVGLATPWLALPAGASTAYVLYRIHRAFAPLPEKSASVEADVGTAGESDARQRNS